MVSDLQETGRWKNLPTIILGQTCNQHRAKRIMSVFDAYGHKYAKSWSKLKFLSELWSYTTRRNFTPEEITVLETWLKYGGTTEELQKELTEPRGGWECGICMETRFREDRAQQDITPSCQHELAICTTCISKDLDFQIVNKPWDEIQCPLCPVRLPFVSVKLFASPAAFERYDQKSLIAFFATIPNFTRCLGPKCDSGQVHGGGDDQPIMTCTSCQFKTCFTHQAPWHKGQTCRQFDEAAVQEHKVQDKKAQERASKRYLDNETKECPNPNCAIKVVKISGCDHMTCRRCKYEYCWPCLVPYSKIRSQGNTAHQRSCKWHSDNFDDE